jgi:hypothetical protein
MSLSVLVYMENAKRTVNLKGFVGILRDRNWPRLCENYLVASVFGAALKE